MEWNSVSQGLDPEWQKWLKTETTDTKAGIAT